jgi:hypothetical protein
MIHVLHSSKELLEHRYAKTAQKQARRGVRDKVEEIQISVLTKR